LSHPTRVGRDTCVMRNYSGKSGLRILGRDRKTFDGRSQRPQSSTARSGHFDGTGQQLDRKNKRFANDQGIKKTPLLVLRLGVLGALVVKNPVTRPVKNPIRSLDGTGHGSKSGPGPWDGTEQLPSETWREEEPLTPSPSPVLPASAAWAETAGADALRGEGRIRSGPIPARCAPASRSCLEPWAPDNGTGRGQNPGRTPTRDESR
jgi:hypothetical protein